jgi:hypothetical protein
MATIDNVYVLLHDGLRPGPNQTSGGGVPIAWIVRKHAEIQAALAALLAQGAMLAEAAGIDPAQFAAETEAARQSVLAAFEQELAAMLTAGDE